MMLKLGKIAIFHRTQKKNLFYSNDAHTLHLLQKRKKNCSVHFIDIVYQLQLQKRASWLPLPMRTKTIALLLENVNSAVSVSDYVLEAKRLFNAAQFCGANIRARHCCLHARRSNYNT